LPPNRCAKVEDADKDIRKNKNNFLWLNIMYTFFIKISNNLNPHILHIINGYLTGVVLPS
jgi:hypothetical protein